MVEYELINPSDPYTFIAPDKEVAALVVFTISTLYGAKSKDGSEEIPVFIFGGSAEWYQEEFGRTPDEGLADRRKQVAGALYIPRHILPEYSLPAPHPDSEPSIPMSCPYLSGSPQARVAQMSRMRSPEEECRS